jgi:hypothetical protein
MFKNMLIIFTTFIICSYIFHMGIKTGIHLEDSKFYTSCVKGGNNPIVCGVYISALKAGRIWCPDCVKGKG